MDDPTNRELAIMMGNVSEKVSRIERKLDSDYVGHDEFTPIKNIVYGLISLILIAVVGALIATVVS